MRDRARALACALLLLGTDRAVTAPPDPAESGTSLPQAPSPEPREPAEPAEPPRSPAPEPDAATKDPTGELRERLAARDRELGSLRSELERLKAKSAASAAPAAIAPTGTDPAPPGTDSPSAGADPTTTDPAVARASGPEPATSAHRVTPLLPPRGSAAGIAAWQRELAAALGAGVIGFGLGWRTLDRRIRRKYGGLKIY